MKKPLLILLLTLLFLSVFQKRSFCQVNPCTNSNDQPIKQTLGTNTVDHSGSTGITCNPNTFFALNGAGDIEEFVISGANATFQSLVLSGANNSIAFCNNLNGGGFNPTFYSSDASNQPTYYNGIGWTNIPSAPSNLYSHGGNGNTLVYIPFVTYSKDIVKYNGSSFTTIYTNPGITRICTADLAVDNAGNIYFPTCQGTTTSISDNIVVISSNGTQIASYPFVHDFEGSYGAFILNGIYYVGLGPVSSTPDVLLPISFAAGSAIAGTAIAMAPNNYLDLASCDPGLPMGIKNSVEFSKEMSISPNPFTDQTTVSFNEEQNNSLIKIVDLLGKEIRTQKFSGKQVVIEKGGLNPGVYFIQLTDDENKISVKKVIVQ